MSAPPRSSRSLWRHPEFLRLWSAQTISALGARIARDGLPLAAVLTIDARPTQLGLLAAMSLGPQLAVGLAGGGLVDRSRRRRIMIICDLARAAVLLTVPLAAWLHVLSIVQLYAVAALAGIGNVFFSLADHAYLPSLIERDQLIDGNAKLSLTDSLAEIGGPGLAGVLVQLLTAPLAIAANALTYLASAWLLGSIRRPEPPPQPTETRSDWRRDLRAGFGVVFANPLVRPVYLGGVTVSLFGSIFAALYTFYAIKILKLTPAMFGVTVAFGGIGALGGALVAPWLARRFGFGASLISAMALAGAATLLIPLARGGPAEAMAFLVAAQLAGDCLAVAAAISSTVLRQSLIPGELLGRSAAAFNVGQGSAAIIGALAGGLLGEALGLRPAMVVASLGLISSVGWAIASPLLRLRSLPAADLASP